VEGVSLGSFCRRSHGVRDFVARDLVGLDRAAPLSMLFGVFRPDFESPLTRSPFSRDAWLALCDAPSVVIANSHWPFAIRSEAWRQGLQKHDPQSDATKQNVLTASC